MAALRGACAAALGRGRRDNPYKRGGPEWGAWRGGLAWFKPIVSREAMKRPKLGRGRARLGPRREWTLADDAVLLAYLGRESAAATGARLGKTGQAVRNRRHRLRKFNHAGECHERPEAARRP